MRRSTILAAVVSAAWGEVSAEARRMRRRKVACAWVTAYASIAHHHVEHRPATLHEVTQPLWHRQHPMTHRPLQEKATK
jgi:hypothetical protein